MQQQMPGGESLIRGGLSLHQQLPHNGKSGPCFCLPAHPLLRRRQQPLRRTQDIFAPAELHRVRHKGPTRHRVVDEIAVGKQLLICLVIILFAGLHSVTQLLHLGLGLGLGIGMGMGMGLIRISSWQRQSTIAVTIATATAANGIVVLGIAIRPIFVLVIVLHFLDVIAKS